MEAWGSRGFIDRSISVMVWQLSQAMTSQWCFVARAAPMVG
jgi:hypothetical protein